MGDSPAQGVTGEWIWLDGEWVPWADANVHILTHSLHYGLGVFEGIRCYRTSPGRRARPKRTRSIPAGSAGCDST